MGAWGYQLYQDDVSQETRDSYKKLLKIGLSNEEATNKLIQDNQYLVNDMDDGPVFWFALADTQWKLGRLLSFVKEKAIQCVESGENLQMWQDQSPRLGAKRKQVLEELVQRLHSQMPEMKKIAPYTYFRNDWKIGDTFAYRLDGEHTRACGLAGRYLVLTKIGDYELLKGNDKDVFPLVYSKITPDEYLPQTLEEIEQYEFVRSMPHFRLKKFYYRTFVWESSIRFYRNLTYLGNYSITPPNDEALALLTVEPDCGITVFSSKHFDRLFAERYVKYRNFTFK